MLRSVRATAHERLRRLPGDDLLTPSFGTVTHAITIHRAAREVWPWLQQMGSDRAGWYSYDRIDNGGRPSAAHILPGLQHLETGAIMPWLPGATEGFTVLGYELDHYLILGWRVASEPTPRMTWAFVLEEPWAGVTRLLVRVRAGPGFSFMGLPPWLAKPCARTAHLLMQRKQLLGIARRAERPRRAGRHD